MDGTARPAAQREAEDHLENCPACRKEMQEVQLTRKWMEALVTEPLVPSPGFYARVRARVEAGSRVWPFWQLLPAFSRQLSFAVVTLLLLLSSYFLTLNMTERPRYTSADLFDVPVIRTEAPVFNADTHTNRERVMYAIVGMEGD